MGEREGGREREEERYRGEDSEGGNTLPIYNGIKYVHTCTAIGNDRASNVLTMDILLWYSSLPHNQLYYTRGELQYIVYSAYKIPLNVENCTCIHVVCIYVDLHCTHKWTMV